MTWVRLAQVNTNTNSWVQVAPNNNTGSVENTTQPTNSTIAQDSSNTGSWDVIGSTSTWEVVTTNNIETTEEAPATNALFTLWERDVSIIVKNASNAQPENTVFKVWEQYFKGSYLIQDFLNTPKDGINVEFSNLKCKYVANVKIDPTVYIKNVVISYWYNSRWDCIHKVEPEEMIRLVSVSTSEKQPLNYTIQLNDLSILHFIAYWFLWLFIAIYLWIMYIKKKKVLIYNKNN